MELERRSPTETAASLSAALCLQYGVGGVDTELLMKV